MNAPHRNLVLDPSFLHPQETLLAAGPDETVTQGRRLFRLFCVFTPILWLLGILTPCAVLLILKLVLARWPRGYAINIVVIAWLAVAVVQVITSILHSIAVGNVAGELHNLVSFSVLGWVFGALIIAVGSSYGLATRPVIRGIAYLGGYVLLLSAAAILFKIFGVTPAYIQGSPLGMLLPQGSAAKLYTSIVLYSNEDTFGRQTARLVLFFPYYTALGLGALAFAFISQLDHDWRWRIIGFLGGAIGAVFSWSRIAVVCLVGVGSLLIFATLNRTLQVVIVLAGIGICSTSLVVGFDPVDGYIQLQNDLREVRPGSSQARDLIYEKSWNGFLESPYFGNGLNFPPALTTEPIAIGSHATIYGLLYTAGLPGLVTFLTAISITLGALAARCARTASSEHRRISLVGLGLAVCLLIFCPFEALYSLTVPCIVLFAWIGASLPSSTDQAPIPAAGPPRDGALAVAGLRLSRPKTATTAARDSAFRQSTTTGPI
jgi:hypothetical protein